MPLETSSLTTRQMEILLTVARAGSVTDAAATLGISQPAVSMMLRECSEAAGFPLFTRKAGKLHPTTETAILIPELERVFDGLHRVRRLVTDLRSSEVGLVRVAAAPLLADTIMPLVLAAFRQRRSQIRLSIISRDHEEIPEVLESRAADLGLSISAFQGRTPNAINLWESELVCVVPSGHSLAAHSAVTPEMLLQFPLITFNRNLPLGAAAEQAFQSAGLARDIAVEVSQTSTACALARSGVGVALVHPLGVIGNVDRSLKAVPFRPRVTFMNQFLLRRGAGMSQSVRLLVATARRAIPEIRRLEALAFPERPETGKSMISGAAGPV